MSKTIDKSAWGEGPWQTEPDREEWTDEATGYPCVAVRHPSMGHWCGYVGVPDGHPLHGKGYDEAHGDEIEEWTFGGKEPGGGERDDRASQWFGFDFAHCYDLVPGMAAFRGEKEHDPNERYRDLDDVKRATVKSAASLAGRASATVGEWRIDRDDTVWEADAIDETTVECSYVGGPPSGDRAVFFTPDWLGLSLALAPTQDVIPESTEAPHGA